MVVSAVDNNSQSSYGGYIGAGVGAVGSAVGIVKANKFFNPKKEFLKDVKGFTQTAVDTYEQVVTPFKKIDIAAVQEEILQKPEVFSEKITEVFSSLKNEMPNTVNFIEEIKSGGKNSLEEFQSDFPVVKEEVLKNLDLIKEKVAPVISDLKAEMPNTADFIEKIKFKGNETKKFIKNMDFAPIKEEILTHGSKVPNKVILALSELGESMPNYKNLVDAIKETMEKSEGYFENLSKGFEKFEPYIKKVEEKLTVENIKPKSILETIDGSLKSLNKYHRIAGIGALLLIPAGFGIGKAVDSITSKANKSETSKEVNA